MLTETFLTCGQPEPPVALIPLRAGPLTMLYDPASGFVRRIRSGEREVLRGLYAAVRDHNWDTVPGTLREVVRKVEDRSFRIEFESEHRQGGIHFAWRGTIHGTADGTLRYALDGEARTTFSRNRIGFCVLHPIRECAGARARQTRTDGRVIECRFPDLIEPQIFGQSSFRDLRAVAHEVADGLWAELEFGGDTFEMEDQRNWTDASFKTYCTPLALPFPVEVKAGARIQQTVTLRWMEGRGDLCSEPIRPVAEASDVVRVAIPNKPTTRLPAIGLGVASHGAPLGEHEMTALRALQLSHLRLDLRLGADDWQTRLEQPALEAGQLGARLELALHLPRQGAVNVDAVKPVLERHAASLVRVLALREGEAATTPETWQTVNMLLGRADVPVGAGSDCNFCELNREQALGRLALSDADFLFWSVNPQVHAFDHLSLIETLEAQAATVNSARAWAGGRPLVMTPVTLKQRFNPVATGPEVEPAPGQLPPQVDPRQLSLFGAAWTLGSLAALTTAGLDHVTCFETTGWRGVMERAAGSSLPGKFPSIPGGAFPLYHVLAAVAGFREAAVITTGGPVVVLVLFGPGPARRVLAGNLSPDPQRVVLTAAGRMFEALRLDADSAREAMQDVSRAWKQVGARADGAGNCEAFTLPPYGLLRWELPG